MMRARMALLAALFAGVALMAEGIGAQQASIKINGPSDGAMVNSPVALNVDIQGVPVRPAAEGDPAAYHYHALVDVDPATVIVPGQPIPTGQANIIHTADRMLMLPDLTPGQHTVVVVLTRTDHVPLAPAVQDRVSFSVGAAGQPAAGQAAGGAAGQTPIAAPRVGTGGGLTGDAQTSRPLLLGLAAVLALGAGGLVMRARRC